MNSSADILWIEVIKAVRSRVPYMTAAGFLLFPLASAFLMFIYRDPEFARSLGILNVKAELIAGKADWPTYLSMFAQGIAIGGIFLFSLVCSWVFGREFADRTVTDLLAVPVARSRILVAKYIVVGLWCAALTLEVIAVGLPLGALLRLPPVDSGVILHGVATTIVAAVLVTIGVFPFAYFAGVGHGYLLPIGMAMITVLLANVIAVIGWGGYFPWSIPALYAAANGSSAELTPASYLIVALTGGAGILLTVRWWNTADISV